MSFCREKEVLLRICGVDIVSRHNKPISWFYITRPEKNRKRTWVTLCGRLREQRNKLSLGLRVGGVELATCSRWDDEVVNKNQAYLISTVVVRKWPMVGRLSKSVMTSPNVTCWSKK